MRSFKVSLASARGLADVDFLGMCGSLNSPAMICKLQAGIRGETPNGLVF